jgi:hypothetical protein
MGFVSHLEFYHWHQALDPEAYTLYTLLVDQTATGQLIVTGG